MTRRRTRSPGSRWVRAGLFLVLLGAGAFALVKLGFVERRVVQNLSLPELTGRATREVTLYFADPRWTRLVGERRAVQEQGGTPDTLRALVAALADGPRGEGVAVLPAEARLQGAYLGKDGLAVIDFEPGVSEFYPGGVSGEILTVFAVVHTLVENVPEIRSVQILVGGKEQETLAGHVKISEPLVPDPQWNPERVPD